MNKKITLCLTIAFAATATFLISSLTKVSNYTLRKSNIQNLISEEENEEEGIAGAMEMWHLLRRNPSTDKVDPMDIYSAIKQADGMKAQRGSVTDLQWQEMGPDNVGGRTRAILVDRNNKNIVYAGGVSGGLWKSTTGGSSWKKVNDQQENLIISCITQTPDGGIFYGTGVQEFEPTKSGTGGSGFAGGGVFYSSDGNKFTKLSKTDPSKSGQGQWVDVQVLASDPTLNKVYAGTQSGVYSSTDKGSTWKKIVITNGIDGSPIHDIKVDVNGVVYVATKSLLYRSDNGTTWTNIKPPGNIMSNSTCRISIGVSHSNPDAIYIMASSSGMTDFGRLEGIYQSKDAGKNWRKIGTRAANGFDFDPLAISPKNGQGYYDCVIAVDPFDEGRIFAAGSTFWEWNDTLNHPKTDWGWHQASPYQANPLYRGFHVHPDNHVIVFSIDEVNKTYTTFIGNDGGLFRSMDGLKTSEEINNGYNVTQYYDMAVASKRPDWPMERIIGGTQDNGTHLINGFGNTNQYAFDVNGGDGFGAEISKIIPDIMFYGVDNGAYRRSLNGGREASYIFDERFIHLVDASYGRGTAKGYTEKTGDFNNMFYTPILLDERWDDSSSIFLITMNRDQPANGNLGGRVMMTRGATDIHLTDNPVWYSIATTATELSKLAISSDWNTVFAGGTTFWGGSSKLYRISGLNTANYDTLIDWDPAKNGIINEVIADFGGQEITCICVDPNNDNRVLITLGNYGSGLSHIMECTNINAPSSQVKFTDISGNLPSMPVYNLVIMKNNSNCLVAGTELGVWVSTNGGQNWVESNKGMARVPVFRIRQIEEHPWEGPTFYIGTHGRGIFKTTSLVTSIEDKANTNIQTKINAYPNPADENINVDFTLEKNTNGNIAIVDMQGKIMFNADYRFNSGVQHINVPTANLPKGIYIIYVKAGSNEWFEKISIL